MSHVGIGDAVIHTERMDEGLLVTWQHPSTHTYYLMGLLQQGEDGIYSFSYFSGVDAKPGFRPVPGFPDTGWEYRSRVLFPFFSGRIMSARRPDRPEWLAAMGLSEDAGPFEVLGRSLGQRVGDTFELYRQPAIEPAEKTVTAQTPIHGLRYEVDGLDLLETGGLSDGDSLRIRPEPTNDSDQRALAVHAASGTQLGYVPVPILDYLERLGYRQPPAEAVAVHVNPYQFGHHQRIIMSVAWYA